MTDDAVVITPDVVDAIASIRRVFGDCPITWYRGKGARWWQPTPGHHVDVVPDDVLRDVVCRRLAQLDGQGQGAGDD